MQSKWLVKKLINCSCFSSFQTKNWKTYCISHQNLSWFSCFYFVWRQKLNCIKAKATVLYESALISICTMYEYVGKVFLYICVYDWRNKNIEKKALQCNKMSLSGCGTTASILNIHRFPRRQTNTYRHAYAFYVCI